MAMKTILDSSRLLNQILQNESQDDSFNVLTKLDLTDVDNASQFHTAQIPSLGGHRSFKFRTCVIKSDVETLSLSVKMGSANLDSDFDWPITVKCKVSVINEKTEHSLDFDYIYTTFNRPSLATQEDQVLNTLLIDLNTIKDFIINNSFLVQWCIQFYPSQQETLSTQNSADESHDIGIMLKEYVKSVISIVKQNEDKLNSAECRQKMEEIKVKVAQCEPDEDKKVIIESRLSEAYKRIDQLLDNVQTQTRQVAAFMTDLKKVVTHQEVSARTNSETFDPSIDIKNSPDVTKTSGDTEGPLTTRELNFLLIGDPQTGKSSTGNSILLKSAFKTGQQTPNLPRVETSRIIISTFNILVTVVEVSGSYLSTYNPTPFKLCPGGFDAILCIDEYRNIKNDCSSVFSCQADTFIDDEALRSYGIVIINGGDSFKLDYPDMAFQDFLREIPNTYEALEDKVQNRVMLFDNTIQSVEKKVLQVAQLVKMVDSLPVRKTRFTEVEFMESETRILKSVLQTLPTLKDASHVGAIKDLFAYYTTGPFEHNEEWHKLMSTIDNIPVKRRENFENNEHLITETDAFKVLIFGKPIGSAHLVMQQIENMGVACHYTHLDLLTHFKEISNFTALLLVVSCAHLLPRDKDVLRKVITKYSNDICKKGILIVIDGGTVDLHVNNREFVEWCNEENDIIKDMLQACAERAVLFDYETSDIVVTREQKANLIKMLHSLLPNCSRAPERDFTLVEKSYSFGQEKKRRKLY